MSTQAQYASIPKLGKAAIAVANALRNGSGAMETLITASPFYQSGTRIDKIQMQAQGDTTIGMLRFFLIKGSAGVAINSITFSATTATVSTNAPHGLTSGDLVTLQGAMPEQYNVTNAACAVTSPTAFSYNMLAAPTASAISMGGYSSIKASEVPSLWREVTIPPVAVTPRTISSLTFSGSTATLFTTQPHGLSSGDTVIISGVTPASYNGTYTITVGSASSFTYTMTTTPTGNSTISGAYVVTKQAFSASMHSQSVSDVAYLPLILPSGWQLRVATNNAEAFNVTATLCGDLQ